MEIIKSDYGWTLKYYTPDIARLDEDTGLIGSKFLEDNKLMIYFENGGNITEGKSLKFDPQKRVVKKIHFDKGIHLIEFKNNTETNNEEEDKDLLD